MIIGTGRWRVAEVHSSASVKFDPGFVYIQYFETKDKKLEERWRYYFDLISREIVHLRRWERRLMQRMERYDGMRDGVC